MPLIAVASQNPVKLQAALDGFRRMFPAETFEVSAVAVPSGVSDQPMTDAETLRGAANRAQAAMQRCPEVDYAVGIEGGASDVNGELHVFAWVVVAAGQTVGKSRTGTFIVPDEVARLVRQGVELGEADDRVFGRSNSKQANGAVGILTDDALGRTEYYTQAVIMALIPFKNPQFSFPSEP